MEDLQVINIRLSSLLEGLSSSNEQHLRSITALKVVLSKQNLASFTQNACTYGSSAHRHLIQQYFLSWQKPNTCPGISFPHTLQSTGFIPFHSLPTGLNQVIFLVLLLDSNTVNHWHENSNYKSMIL